MLFKPGIFWCCEKKTSLFLNLVIIVLYKQIPQFFYQKHAILNSPILGWEFMKEKKESKKTRKHARKHARAHAKKNSFKKTRNRTRGINKRKQESKKKMSI